MSYSFTIVATTKEDATRQIREQFDAVVAAQPSHEVDKEAVVVAAQSFVRSLAEPHDGDEIYIAINGSVGWINDDPKEFLSVGTTISVSLRNKAK
jgi:hypothetical protein